MSDDRTATWAEAEWSVYGKVRAFVADAADVPLERVEPTTHLYEELEVDSLGFVLIFINLEEDFGISEPENFEELGQSLLTPADIVEFALSLAKPEDLVAHG